MRLRYLVTGTGRCGTVYMARMLTSLGIPCGHEAIFDYCGIDCAAKRLSEERPLSWSYVSRAERIGETWRDLEQWWPDKIEAEASYMAAPYLANPLLAGVPVIHVVRDPIKVVHSFVDFIDYFKSSKPMNSYEDHIYRFIPELTAEMPAYDRACLFYVRWNEMIERSQPALFHRIEDDKAAILKFLSKDGSYFNDRTINTFKKPTADHFRLDNIQNRSICKNFIDLGERYGYPMRSEYLLM